MDISNNQLSNRLCNRLGDQYLINPIFAHKLISKNNNTKISNENLKFYRKRIFSITKDYFTSTAKFNNVVPIL